MSDTTTANRLENLAITMSKTADPDRDFFYLGGPMTGIPQFNFPRFNRVADKLRKQGYNIVSPSELDDPDTLAAAMASVDGAPGSGNVENGGHYHDFLSRDLVICALPRCVGGIFLEGWAKSRGARGESWVLSFLEKQILCYEEDDSGRPILHQVARGEYLRYHGVADGVPQDAPGLLTIAGDLGVEHVVDYGQYADGKQLVSNAGAVDVSGDFREPSFA